MCPEGPRGDLAKGAVLGRDEGEENDEVREETAASDKTDLVLDLTKASYFRQKEKTLSPEARKCQHGCL